MNTLRWYIAIDRYEGYNSRTDGTYHTDHPRKPVLQYWDKWQNKWVTVPTVEEVIKQ